MIPSPPADPRPLAGSVDFEEERGDALPADEELPRPVRRRVREGPARARNAAPAVQPKATRVQWSSEEDALLRAAVADRTVDKRVYWSQVMLRFPERKSTSVQ